jgi:peroxiredoxin
VLLALFMGRAFPYRIFGMFSRNYPAARRLSPIILPMASNRPNSFLGLALVFAIFGVASAIAAIKFLNPAPPDDLIAHAARKSASLQMPALDGPAFSLADHQGRVILLNYFATWCPPCITEIPDLVAIAHDDHPRGLDLAAISLDAPDAKRHDLLVAFAKSHELPFPILLPASDSPLFRSNMTIPQTLLIDKQGRTAYHLTGRLDPADLRAKIDRLLAEQ